MKMILGGVVKANVTLKQGYLYIKRERNSDRVNKRALSKPWQRAYFILYRDPIFFEEFKDASLKSRKHIHLISIIKHVGPIKTSKSKPHAFEVIDEKATLLLACDNEILLDEWTKVFVEVMNKRKEQSRCDMERCPNGVREGYTYDVEIVDTTLSGVNELHGEYLAVISNTRMSLLDPDNNNEVLSWPLSHITIHNSQPPQNRIMLVMGRNCHFGSGKLIFSTKEYAQMMIALNNLIIRKKRICSTVSTPQSSPTRSPLKSSKSRPPLTRQTGSIDDILYDEEFREYKIPGSTRTSLDVSDGKAFRIPSLHGSCPSINDLGHSPKPSATRMISACVLKRNDELISDIGPDGYIEPNTIPEDEKKTNRERNKESFKRGSPERISIIGRPSSLAISDDVDNLYLDLEPDNAVDEVVTSAEQLNNLSNSPHTTDEDVRGLAEIIMGELEDPQRHRSESRHDSVTAESHSSPTEPRRCEEIRTSLTESTFYEGGIRTRNSSSPLPSFKKTKSTEQRRISEPITFKKIIDHVRKPKAFSVDQQHSPDLKRHSPRLSPKQKTISLPKQNSMNPRDIFEKIAEKSFKIQNKSQFPDPKGDRRSSSRPCSTDFSRDSVSVTVTTRDDPPPLPFRESPELLQRAHAHDLTITIREGTKDRSNTLPVTADRIGTITVNSSRTYTTSVPDPTSDTSEPPPIPPKSKLLSLTKSSSPGDVNDEYSDDASRRSSCGDDSLKGEQDNIESEKDDGSPPEVPERNYNTRNLVKPCASNQISNEMSTKKRPSPLASKPPISKSLDSLSFVSSSQLPCPEEKTDTSPPPRRRFTHSNPPMTHAIILEGAGKEYPSISVTKLMEQCEEAS